MGKIDLLQIGIYNYSGSIIYSKLKVVPEENKQIFETLFHSANEGIIIVNDRGTIVKANPSAKVMFGYNDTLEGMSVDMLLPENLRKSHLKHRGKYSQDPKTRAMGQDLELFGKHLEGTIFPVEVSLSPSEVDGNPVVIAFVIDITERRKREQVELNMGRMFNQSFNEIYIFDSGSLKFIRVNQAAIDNLGYSMEELQQMTPLDIKPEFTNSSFAEKIDPLRQGTPKIQFETSHQRKDGSVYPVEVHLQLTTFDMKQVFMAIIMDISERKQAEQNLLEYSQQLENRVEERTKELRESQKMYSAIARNFPDGMISVFDRDYRYVFVEGKELFALGITSEMLLGKRYLDRLAPEVAQKTKRELMDVFKGVPKSIEIKFKDNDYVLDAVPIRDQGGTITHILVIEKNITKRKRDEEKVRKALEHERELSELKSQFVSTASHEFRTPLSTILSSVSLLSKYTSETDQDKREKHIQRIKGSVHNLTGILNDFLSMDKLETGVVKANPAIFELEDFIRDVCDQLAPTLKKDQSIQYHHSGQNQAYLDKHILKNILFNLISNASKYSDQLIEMSTSLSNGQLLITVRDRGIGISEQDQKHLFEKFFRSKNTINIPGTGLGLNIVKKYTDMMGGKIDVFSILGEGTTFTVKLKQPQKNEKNTVD